MTNHALAHLRSFPALFFSNLGQTTTQRDFASEISRLLIRPFMSQGRLEQLNR